MTSNQLQLTPAESDVLWCASVRRQRQIPSDSVRMSNTSVISVTAVHYLRVYLDSDVSVASRSHQSYALALQLSDRFAVYDTL